MKKFALVCLMMIGVGFVVEETIVAGGDVVEEHADYATGCGCGKPKPKE